MNGRMPTPAKTIDRNENHKSKDYINKRVIAEEKIKTADRLEPPSGMSSVAKKEWKRIMGLYRQMEADILNDLDISALMMYCEAYAVYRKAEKVWVNFSKLKDPSDTDYKIFNRARVQMNDQVKVVCQLSEQLCLTPVGRARMGIAMAKKKEQSSLAKLFQGGDGDDDGSNGDENPIEAKDEEDEK